MGDYKMDKTKNNHTAFFIAIAVFFVSILVNVYCAYNSTTKACYPGTPFIVGSALFMTLYVILQGAGKE